MIVHLIKLFCSGNREINKIPDKSLFTVQKKEEQE